MYYDLMEIIGGIGKALSKLEQRVTALENDFKKDREKKEPVYALDDKEYRVEVNQETKKNEDKKE